MTKTREEKTNEYLDYIDKLNNNMKWFTCLSCGKRICKVRKDHIPGTVELKCDNCGFINNV